MARPSPRPGSLLEVFEEKLYLSVYFFNLPPKDGVHPALPQRLYYTVIYRLVYRGLFKISTKRSLRFVNILVTNRAPKRWRRNSFSLFLKVFNLLGTLKRILVNHESACMQFGSGNFHSHGEMNIMWGIFVEVNRDTTNQVYLEFVQMFIYSKHPQENGVC